MVLSTLGFVSVPTDKILKVCSQANLGAVPLKMFAHIYCNEDSPPPILVWRTHPWVLSKQFRYPCVTIHMIKPTNALILKLHISFTICPNSDLFRSILNIFRDLLIIKTNVLIQTVLIFNNSQKMTKTDQKLSELWQIVRKKYSFKISAFVCFIVLFVY